MWQGGQQVTGRHGVTCGAVISIREQCLGDGIHSVDRLAGNWQVNKLDWLVWMTSTISTVCLGVEVGLAISIGLALLMVVYESAFPRISVLGCLPQTTIYRCTM